VSSPRPGVLGANRRWSTRRELTIRAAITHGAGGAGEPDPETAAAAAAHLAAVSLSGDLDLPYDLARAPFDVARGCQLVV
jgi:hypothetical protein